MKTEITDRLFATCFSATESLKYCGGYKGLDGNQMVCNLCNENHLGEEYHIMIRLRILVHNRKKYFPKYYLNVI